MRFFCACRHRQTRDFVQIRSRMRFRRLLFAGLIFSGAMILGHARLESAARAQSAPDSPKVSPLAQLMNKSALGEALVQQDLRLGTFAVDIGLREDGDESTIQRNYVMASVLAASVSRRIATGSNRSCSLVLWAIDYSTIRAFMYKRDKAAPDEQVIESCLENLKENLATVERNDRVIQEEIEELKRTHAPSAEAGNRLPLFDAIAGVGDAILHIYPEGTAIRTLLSVGASHFAQVSSEEFRIWINRVRSSGRIQISTADPRIRKYLGVSDGARVGLWPPLPTPKTLDDIIRLNHFETPSIRIAVLVAVNPPDDGKVRNAAVAKYCREQWNMGAAQPAPLQSGCWFENVFDRETWVAFYYGAADGPDMFLQRKAASIAADPVVTSLAARRSVGEQLGHPYVAIFGEQGH
jgi:hypothetical protein